MNYRNLSLNQRLILIMTAAIAGSLGISLLLLKTGTSNISKKLGHQPLRSSNQTIASPPATLNKTFEVPQQFHSQTIYQAKLNPTEKVLALTFDDGPWPKTTAQVLAILKQNNIKATFFLVGQPLESFPDIAKQVVAEGHAIGNHTWHHWYKMMSDETAATEIEYTSALIYRLTGVKTALFRPPGGFLKNGLAKYAKQRHDAVIMWSNSAADTDRHAQVPSLINNVVKGAKPGGIVLMHDGGGDHSKTVQALPQIIAGLKAQGYRFVTVPELLEMQKKQ
jgi:peptidoglycan-N-acetylglucosamine deacetylase